jgi:uncharacterized repeat protein (TIGR03803 family)
VFAFCTASAVSTSAQNFITLLNFDETNGSGPNPPLVQGFDGNYYGTTNEGGDINSGTVFKITSAGDLTTLFTFVSGENGNAPTTGLAQAVNGRLYGTTEEGGANGYGTFFGITSTGKVTTLYSFCSQTGCTDGYFPYAALVQGTDGNFYGTTDYGGAYGEGTVFKVTVGGRLTTLHSFCPKAGCADGYFPYAGLVQGTDRNFYGTTVYGGTHGSGTVFRISSMGKLSTLYSFCSQLNCADGSFPMGVIQANDGNFYGATQNGGRGSDGGTVFKITPAGKLTTLYNFCSQTGCIDGSHPSLGLIQATDGNLYGTTIGGGASNKGTVFSVKTAGRLTMQHSFDGTDGEGSSAGLVQSTDGNFYGTTFSGGSSGNCYQGCGTAFRLSVGLDPFVETPPSGTEGATVIILGTNLMGVTEVSFNGTPAKFAVVSATEMKTIVPAGAKTGTVEVTTPKGTLKSSRVFRVTPQITSFTPTSGAVGTTVTITGTELTQTTQITFHGVKATTFNVKSDSEAIADVPSGAKTGKIAITTAGGTATSSGTFTVTP